MAKKLLSIAIPTYNRSKYLQKNLSFLLSQFTDEIEILVSDNASTDETAKVVSGYIEQGLPIRYFRNRENVGWAKNFQNCYFRANAEYIMILGDDDLIIHEGVDVILSALKRTSCDVLYCSIYGYSYNHCKEMPKYNKPTKIYGQREVFLSDTILSIRQISSIAIKSTYINRNESRVGNFAHLYNIFRAIAQGKKFAAIRRPIIACKADNSDFVNTVNFSDVYVKEFFVLFREYFANILPSSAMTKIENKMLLSYYPIYIYKMRTARLKNDDNMRQNFDTIFQRNRIYTNFLSFIFHKNYLVYTLLLMAMIAFSKIKQGLLFHYIFRRRII